MGNVKLGVNLVSRRGAWLMPLPVRTYEIMCHDRTDGQTQGLLGGVPENFGARICRIQ